MFGSAAPCSPSPHRPAGRLPHPSQSSSITVAAPTHSPAPCSQQGPGRGVGDSLEAVESESDQILFLSLLVLHPLMF